MAKVNKQQQEFIRNQFVDAYNKKVEALAKAVKPITAEHYTTVTAGVTAPTISRWGSRSGCEVYVNEASFSRVAYKKANAKSLAGLVAQQKKLNAVAEKADKMWQEVEQAMILGDTELKEILADALAGLTKL